MTIRRIQTAVFLSLLVLLAPTLAAAGSIWLEPDRGNELRLEAVKPRFKFSDLSTFSMAWFLSGNFEVGENLRLSFDLPYAHFAPDSGYDSSNTVGNPYLGVDMGAVEKGLAGDLGVRLPIASDTEIASFLGTYTDFVDRAEAFMPNVLTISAGIGYRHITAEGAGVRLRLSPVLWAETEDGTLSDGMELWVRYSAQAFYRNDTATIGGGLSGRYLATDDGPGGFGEKSMHEFGLFANLDFGQLQPGLRVRLPLDEDMTDIMDPSFVLSVGVQLP